MWEPGWLKDWSLKKIKKERDEAFAFNTHLALRLEDARARIAELEREFCLNTVNEDLEEENAALKESVEQLLEALAWKGLGMRWAKNWKSYYKKGGRSGLRLAEIDEGD